jgi:YHS domain-containing protein
MKILMSSICVAAIMIVLSLPTEVEAQTEVNNTCPVMIGQPIKKKLFVDYQGKRVYLCCRPCVKAFKKNPEKYIPNLYKL